MIELHREAEPSKALARNYDYVIVGAGSAGCAVARRLVDGCDATILLLEAGGGGGGGPRLSKPPPGGGEPGARYHRGCLCETGPPARGAALPPGLGAVAR